MNSRNQDNSTPLHQARNFSREYPLLFMAVHQMSLSAFTPSLGFVSGSILVRKVFRVWITPCVPLLGELFSVAPEPFCRVLDPLVRLIVPGKFKPSWPRQTQGLVTLSVCQLTLPLTALVPSPNSHQHSNAKHS